MKSYAKHKGWLFPLIGGPWGKRKGSEPTPPWARRDITPVEMRFGWNREGTVEAALAELPDTVVLPTSILTHDGHTGTATIVEDRYEQRPAFYTGGKRKGERKMAKAERGGPEVPKVEYVYVGENVG